MVLLKTLRSDHLYSFLRHQNTSPSLQSPPHCFPSVHECISRVSSFFPTIFHRNLSIIAQLVSSDAKEERIQTKSTDSEEEQKKRKKMKALDVKSGRTKSNNPRSLFAKNLGDEEKSDASSKREQVPHESLELKPLKELSPEIVLLVNRLYEEGYFKNANFLPPEKLDLISCFSKFYSRNFLLSAAKSFGKDHPEIRKSLSFSDLEMIARFGCPSVEKKTAFAAKRLRSFFRIQEDIVCRACTLKSSCKVVNQIPWKRQQVRKKKDGLILIDLMKVLTLYGLELVPAQLVIPNEIKDSVSKLLRVVVNTNQISLEEKFDASEGEQVHELKELKPLKELSPEIVWLVTRLYEEGYLKNANFLPPETLDLSCFSTYYSRDFIRSAAQRFGRDHKEIKEMLSFSDLETIARFGCPSVEKNTAFAAKRLRSFFRIQEDIVCQACNLKSSCTVMNQIVGKRKIAYLSSVDIMRVLTLYGLELVPAQLVIPNEIKDSIRKLLGVVVNPSQISHEDPNPGVRGI